MPASNRPSRWAAACLGVALLALLALLVSHRGSGSDARTAPGAGATAPGPGTPQPEIDPLPAPVPALPDEVGGCSDAGDARVLAEPYRPASRRPVPAQTPEALACPAQV